MNLDRNRIEEALLDLATRVADGSEVDWEREVLDLGPHASQIAAEMKWIAMLGGMSPPPNLRTDPDIVPEVPTEWAHLAIRSSLGEGAQGKVYLALDTRLDREVALKLVPAGEARLVGSTLSGSSPVLQRAYDEARQLARVHHRNVVMVHGVECTDGWLGMWTERIEGSTLSEMLERVGPLGSSEAAIIGLDLCQALAAVHEQGLTHGDIKCENVMRESGGRVVLMDFGLVQRSADPSQADSVASQVRGTPSYMAPELFRGIATSFASDLYALGCLLFHLTTRSFPSPGNTVEEIIRGHADGLRYRLRDARPDLPDDFVRIVENCLDADASSRYASAGELGDALSRIVGFGPSDPTPEVETHAPTHNLPRQISSFIGRERQMSDIERIVRRDPLLTLTGPGGCGKTRLAIEVGHRVLESFPDGIWWIDLAPIRGEEHVDAAVVSQLNLTEQPGRPLVDTIQSFLREKTSLLLFDNCEHVVGECEVLAHSLLTAAPELHILATSRQPLGLTGETNFVVPPLNVPGDSDPLQELRDSEACQLFVDRARSLQSDFDLDEDNSGSIRQICRRLDGIPLALELAAARTRDLSVGEIAEQLDDRFRLLVSQSRTSLPRHRTLEAMIEWSYELLTENERKALRRLSVFVGGWSQGAAKGVCRDSQLATEELQEAVERLVGKSMIQNETDPAESHPQSRYRMLETVREFAENKLSDSGEEPVTRRRHGAFFLRLAQETETELTKGDTTRGLQLFRIERANLLGAVEWFESDNDDHALWDLISAQSQFWINYGQWSLAEKMFERLDRKEVSGTLRESRAYLHVTQARAILAANFGDFETARRHFETCLVQHEKNGNTIQIAGTLNNLAMLDTNLGEDGSARTRYTRAIETIRKTDDHNTLISMLLNLGELDRAAKLFDAARHRLEEAHSLAVSKKLLRLEALVTGSLGALERESGDFEAARTHMERSARILRKIGDVPSEAAVIHNLANLHFYNEDYRKSHRLHGESLGLFRKLDEGALVASSMSSGAVVCLLLGKWDEARSLLEEGLARAERTENRPTAGNIHTHLGALATEHGDLSEAARRLNEGVKILQEVGNPDEIVAALQLRGLVHREVEEFALARKDFEAAQEVSQRAGLAGSLLETRAMLAELDLRLGSRTEAMGHLVGALQALDGNVSLREWLSILETSLLAVTNRETPEESTIQVFGACEEIRDSTGLVRARSRRASFFELVEKFRVTEGDSRYREEVERGRGLTLSEARDLILERIEN